MSQAGSTLAGGGGGGGVTSVSGTANRITSTGGANPVIDIAATYVGQTSITTLGTVTTGTWNGSTIGVPYGGTGAVTLTNHGVLIGQGTSPIVATAAGTAGQVLQSGGAAADPLYSTATYPSTVSQANFLYGSASNVVSGLAPTTMAGGFPTYDGTNAVWFAPQNYVYEWDDFIAPTSATTGYSKLSWSRISAAGGSISTPSGDQSSARPGIVRMALGTSVGGVGGITLVTSANNCVMVLGGGRWVFNFWLRIPTLSDATDTFTVNMGLSDTNNGNMRLHFKYNSGINSGNWQIISSQGGTNTQNTTTAADTNWHRYTIDINAANTSAAFFIDNVQVANSPLVANLTTDAVGPTISIQRTSGSSNDRWINLDLFTMWNALTSSR